MQKGWVQIWVEVRGQENCQMLADPTHALAQRAKRLVQQIAAGVRKKRIPLPAAQASGGAQGGRGKVSPPPPRVTYF